MKTIFNIIIGILTIVFLAKISLAAETTDDSLSNLESAPKVSQGLSLESPEAINPSGEETKETPSIQSSVNRPADLLTGAPTDYLIIITDDLYNSVHIDNLANYRAIVSGGNF